MALSMANTRCVRPLCRGWIDLIPSGGVDVEQARIIHDGTLRNGGVARDKREDRLVSLVYLLFLVCLVEPDQPSPFSLESGIRACSRSFMNNAG